MRKYLIVALVCITGCADEPPVQPGHEPLFQPGPRQIECYSGGQLIYKGVSVDEPVMRLYREGLTWRDSLTGEEVDSTADCIMRGP